MRITVASGAPFRPRQVISHRRPSATAAITEGTSSLTCCGASRLVSALPPTDTTTTSGTSGPDGRKRRCRTASHKASASSRVAPPQSGPNELVGEGGLHTEPNLGTRAGRRAAAHPPAVAVADSKGLHGDLAAARLAPSSTAGAMSPERARHTPVAAHSAGVWVRACRRPPPPPPWCRSQTALARQRWEVGLLDSKPAAAAAESHGIGRSAASAPRPAPAASTTTASASASASATATAAAVTAATSCVELVRHRKCLEATAASSGLE